MLSVIIVKKVLLSKVCLLGIGVALSAASFSLYGAALNISQIRSEAFLECIEVKDNRFDLSFIHSVSLTPVIDQYVITMEGEQLSIFQTSEHFTAHGQGLPSSVDEPDAYAFESKDGEFILKLNRAIPDLIVRTDSRFKNRLHTKGVTVNLNKWSDIGLHIVPIKSCQSGMKTVIEK